MEAERESNVKLDVQELRKQKRCNEKGTHEMARQLNGRTRLGGWFGTSC